mgnify:CR=1 FL=1
METFLLTFLIFLLAVGGLAVGVLFGRAPLKGSCGGLACTKGISCGACQRGKEGPDD